MTDCSSCDSSADGIEWRGEQWCTDCFEETARARGASDDWLRRVLGTLAKPTFEPPLSATAVELDSRRELLTEYTLLDETEATLRALEERGLSDDEIASWMETDEETVIEHREQIEQTLERAQNTLQILD